MAQAQVQVRLTRVRISALSNVLGLAPIANTPEPDLSYQSHGNLSFMSAWQLENTVGKPVEQSDYF